MRLWRFFPILFMIDIQNKTRTNLPNIPFEQLANSVLGKKYELSVVFIGNKRSRDLNKKYKNKDKATNILSFPLSKTDGEIFINLNLSYSQAAKFKRSKTNFIAFLFIHGMFHLKGFEHGSTMDREEAVIRTQFGI